MPSTADVDALSPVRMGEPRFFHQREPDPTDVATAADVATATWAPLRTENVQPLVSAGGGGMIGATFDPAFTNVHIGSRCTTETSIVYSSGD